MAYASRCVVLCLAIWLAVPGVSVAASGGATANAPPELELLSAVPDPVLRKLVENTLRQFKKGRSSPSGLDATVPDAEAEDEDNRSIEPARRLKPGDTVLLQFDTQPPPDKRRDPPLPVAPTTPPPFPATARTTSSNSMKR